MILSFFAVCHSFYENSKESVMNSKDSAFSLTDIFFGDALSKLPPVKTDQQFNREVKKDIAQLNRLITKGVFKLSDLSYVDLSVEIDPRRRLADWFLVGNYDCIGVLGRTPEKNLTNTFTIVQDERKHPYKVNLRAFCFNRWSNIAVLRKMCSNFKWHMPSFVHLAAVGEQCPMIQVELKRIINPSYVWRDECNRQYVSSLSGSDPIKIGTNPFRALYLERGANLICDSKTYYLVSLDGQPRGELKVF